MLAKVFNLYGWRGIISIYRKVYWTQYTENKNPISFTDNGDGKWCFFGKYSDWCKLFGIK